jgi:type I restriction enzyme S subunit
VGDLPVPIPSLDEQRDICAFVLSLEERLAAEQLALDELQTVKSALMSVLFTGELRVTPDSEPV